MLHGHMWGNLGRRMLPCAASLVLLANAGFAPAQTPVYTWQDLHDIRTDLSGTFMLMADLGPSSPGYAALAGPAANSGQGWIPIGTWHGGNQFTGTFDGQGRTITGLTINRPGAGDTGLFGYANGATLQNVALRNANVTSGNFAATLAGVAANCMITDVEASGTVTGNSVVGGLIGAVNDGSQVFHAKAAVHVTATGAVAGGAVGAISGGLIQSCFATGNVNGTDSVGGLLGAANGSSSLLLSGASGTVTGENYVGGLVGHFNGTVVAACYATGNATAGGSYCGGLLGGLTNAHVTKAFASGPASGMHHTGGLIGAASGSTIEYAYALGPAHASANFAGGLVAYLNAGNITQGYASGPVSTPQVPGGLVGAEGNPSTVHYSYWDLQGTGQETSAGGTGLGTLAMKGIPANKNMTGFEFASVWYVVEMDYEVNGFLPIADGFPILRDIDTEVQLRAMGVLPAGRAIGDFNNDGCVGFADFIFLLDQWGEMIEGTPMGFPDFLAMLEHWGEGC